MNRACARLWSAFSDALVPALLDLPLRRERASKATDSWERTNRACLDWADARLDATLAPAIALCADHPGAAEALLPTLADALPPFAASGRDALAEKACEAAAGILRVAAAGRGSVRRAEDQKKLNAKEGVPLDVLSAARDGAVETLRAAARQIRGDAFAADIKNGFEKGAERGGSRGGGSRGVSADDDASARRHAAVAAMHSARYAAEALAREASRDLGDDETPHAVRIALLDVLGELNSDASAANLASVEALADADDSRSKKNGDKAPHTPYFPRGPNPLMRVELSAGKVLLGALTAEIGAETARLQAVVSEESESSSDGGLRSSGRLAALRSRLVAHAERAVALEVRDLLGEVHLEALELALLLLAVRLELRRRGRDLDHLAHALEHDREVGQLRLHVELRDLVRADELLVQRVHALLHLAVAHVEALRRRLEFSFH